MRNTAVCRAGAFALFCATAVVFDAAFVVVFFTADLDAVFAAGFLCFNAEATGAAVRRFATAVLEPPVFEPPVFATATRSPGYATGIATSEPGSGSSS